MNSLNSDFHQLSTHIDLIELKPYITVNLSWISDIFQHEIRRFDGCLRANSFPIFIVNGSTEYGVEERSICYKLFADLSKEGHSFGLIHVMDEIYDHDLSVYNLNKCSIVFREYFKPTGGKTQFWIDFCKSFFTPYRLGNRYSGAKRLAYEFYVRLHPKFVFPKFTFMKRQYLPSVSKDKVFSIPLGFTDRIALMSKANPPPIISARRYMWSFCGDSFKSDRQLMLDCLRNIQPNFIHEYHGFFGDRSLSGEEYWEVLTQSIFVPCSIGNRNIDTYRLFEALEAKSIPIVLKNHDWQPYNYYKNLLGEHPIPTFSSWKEAQSFLTNIDSSSIKKLSQEVVDWHTIFKSELKAKIHKSLSEATGYRLLSHDIVGLKLSDEIR